MNNNLKFGSTSPTNSSYVGRGSNSLGINTNEDFNTVIDKLIDKLETIPKPLVEEISYDLNSAGYDFMISDIIFNVNITTSASGIMVTHSVTGLTNTPSSVQVFVEGMKNGYKSIIINGKELNSGFSIAPNNLPATLNAEMIILSDSGENLYKVSIPLSVENTSFKNNFQVKKSSSTSIKSQNDINKVLDSNIVALKNQVGAMSRINIKGPIEIPENSDLPTAFNKLYSETVNIKESLKKLDVPTSVGTTVESLNAEIANLKSQVTTLLSEINRLDSQYGNLSVLLTNGVSGGDPE